MTNLEKFREVFGYTPDTRLCISPLRICDAQVKKYKNDPCETCPFNDWWSKEYKPCFSMKEEFEE